MQTFLPYPNFRESLQTLDMKRLGKQRVEGYQVLIQLTGHKAEPLVALNNPLEFDYEPVPTQLKGWGNHPMTRMWRGYEDALAVYTCIACLVWKDRGYQDTVWAKVLTIVPGAFDRPLELPWWIGWEPFHLSHQSNLVLKDPEHYGPKFLGVPPGMPYIWPV